MLKCAKEDKKSEEKGKKVGMRHVDIKGPLAAPRASYAKFSNVSPKIMETAAKQQAVVLVATLLRQFVVQSHHGDQSPREDETMT